MKRVPVETALRFRSLEVEGHGAIRHLRLPQLERVNLFVGANNAGKTSLLEAVRLRCPGPRVQFVPAQGSQAATHVSLWERAAEAGYAAVVEDMLRIIVPELERVHAGGEGEGRRIMLQLRGSTRPAPIASMGDGTSRVFGIALALVQARDGVLLIDGVEKSLHHSVQEDVWSAIFDFAEEQDVQVFATTHSWDAVVAFQAAANDSQSKALLYRLERGPDGRMHSERYTAREVAIAAEQLVEVR